MSNALGTGGEAATEGQPTMRNTSSPKFVVFDLGNVLIRWDAVRALEPTLGREAADDFLSNPQVDFMRHNLTADGGRPWQDIIADWEKVDPAWGLAGRTYVANFADAVGEDMPQTVAILHELVAQGVPVFALTNWSAELFHHAENRYDFLRLFRGIVVSGRVGLVKPQREIFDYLDRTFTHEIGPLRAGLFVDDSLVNVDGARAAGMDAVQFTDADRLRVDLVARGLLQAGRASESSRG